MTPLAPDLEVNETRSILQLCVCVCGTFQAGGASPAMVHEVLERHAEGLRVHVGEDAADEGQGGGVLTRLGGGQAPLLCRGAWGPLGGRGVSYCCVLGRVWAKSAVGAAGGRRGYRSGLNRPLL